MHTYTIKGTPVPWARPRQNGRVFFDSQRSIKNLWAVSLENQAEGQPFYNRTPLHLDVKFIFQPPTGFKPLTRVSLMGKPYILKKDLDNMVKFVMDSCSGILFDDDSCIYKVSAEKVYGEEACTTFGFIPLECNTIKTMYGVGARK